MTALQARPVTVTSLKHEGITFPRSASCPGLKYIREHRSLGTTPPPSLQPAIATILVLYNLQQTWLICISATNNSGCNHLGAWVVRQPDLSTDFSLTALPCLLQVTRLSVVPSAIFCYWGPDRQHREQTLSPWPPVITGQRSSSGSRKDRGMTAGSPMKRNSELCTRSRDTTWPAGSSLFFVPFCIPWSELNAGWIAEVRKTAKYNLVGIFWKIYGLPCRWLKLTSASG